VTIAATHGCELCADIRQAVFTVNHHPEAEPHCGKCGREIPVVRVSAEDYQERVAPFAHIRTPGASP
jgi:ribosomal protein L37AE/L43A